MSRKKVPLFGGRIEPRCDYCQYGTEQELGVVTCAKKGAAPAACKRFVYDPLKRKPRNLPNLPAFDPKDFML